MAGMLLPLLLLIGGYIWYEKFGGKSTIDGIFNEIKSVGSGDSKGNGGFSSSGFEDLKKGRTGQWTDENNNRFNVQSDTNTQSNIGGSGSIVQKQSNVFYTIPRFGNL